ncbi:hypothetical protein PR048_000486 [Dryococelus australis]|uniref:Uncharacterized protein n=1 Tax=Dryococelus australis TaxID=614101 RepID=A0ABQ9IFN3_9NEOP|nr:hypothetical protein PR048_000486 [Dryococelus australis]
MRVIEVSMEQHRNERAGENRRSLRKPADQRHRPARDSLIATGTRDWRHCYKGVENWHLWNVYMQTICRQDEYSQRGTNDPENDAAYSSSIIILPLYLISRRSFFELETSMAKITLEDKDAVDSNPRLCSKFQCTSTSVCRVRRPRLISRTCATRAQYYPSTKHLVRCKSNCLFCNRIPWHCTYSSLRLVCQVNIRRRCQPAPISGAEIENRCKTELFSKAKGGHGGIVVGLLASHLDELGSIPGGVDPGFLHVGVIPDDAAGLRVFSGISHFPHPFIPAPFQTRFASLALTFKALICVGMKGRGKREIAEKTRQPKTSSGTIPTCENPVTRPGIKPGSPWWEASVLIGYVADTRRCCCSRVVPWKLPRTRAIRSFVAPARGKRPWRYSAAVFAPPRRQLSEEVSSARWHAEQQLVRAPMSPVSGACHCLHALKVAAWVGNTLKRLWRQTCSSLLTWKDSTFLDTFSPLLKYPGRIAPYARLYNVTAETLHALRVGAMDETLGVRVSVARIAPSLLDLGRAAPTNS